MVKKKIWLGLFLAFLFGCNSSGGISLSPPQPTIIPQLDLSGEIDGQAWDGLSVGPEVTAHDIKIVSKTDVNEFRVITCHRFLHFEDAIKTGWFRPNRGFEFTFNDAPGIEDTGECPIRLQAYSKDLDKDGNPIGSAYGIILFKSSKFQLMADNVCNGADGISTGTSVCQSMAGLVERLKFDVQVIAANPTPVDNMPQPCTGKFIDAFTWEYKMPAGECFIEFAETAKPHRRHLHFAYGFTKVVYRGNP